MRSNISDMSGLHVMTHAAVAHGSLLGFSFTKSLIGFFFFLIIFQIT